jgi:replicative DNA helicase
MTDSESFLIALIAQDPSWTRKHQAQISPAIFGSPVNRALYEAITECGSEWDMVSITNALRKRNKLDDVGGPAGVSELWTSFPVHSMAQHHLKTVRETSTLRRALQAHAEAQDKLTHAISHGIEDAAALLSEIREQVEGAAKLPGKRLPRLSAAEVINQVIDELEERATNPGKIAGLSTGFSRMDQLTHGLQEGHLWVFAGEPGDGKSSIMQNALEAAARVASTSVYQLEMSVTEQGRRFLVSDAQVDSGNLLRGLMSYEELQAIAKSAARLKKSGTQFVNTDGATAADILADIDHGSERVVMLDYLQLLDIDEKKGENREQAISRITKDLKSVAKRKGITVLTASQLNDDGRLRESRAIGQHADKVIYVRKVENADGEYDMKRRRVILEKNRGGPPKERIDMIFNGASFSFREATADDLAGDEESQEKPKYQRRRK